MLFVTTPNPNLNIFTATSRHLTTSGLEFFEIILLLLLEVQLAVLTERNLRVIGNESGS